jgi:endonuclease/exonuclease/phosphatase family metal-dependent hydrolase
MARLDRVLASVNWDIKYPLSKIDILPRSVSDHNPIKISFGMRGQNKESVFRFEKW